ncbi:MAG: hypothetical protein AB7F78_01870 [Hyphomicrobiaceae bacterium]
MQHPPVVARRPVGLAQRWKAVRLAVDGEGVPLAEGAVEVRQLVKVSPAAGLPTGLSSGASSALVQEPDGRVVRIKRCGFATKGVGGPAGQVGRIGFMSLAEALQECRMLATFRAQGLCDACIPEAIDILADRDVPFFKEGAYASVRIRIASDVRADEWLLALIAEELAAAGLPGAALRITRDEIVGLADPPAALAALRRSRAFERTALLGRGLGGLLRAVHDAGLLRGRGSVWMGNDIVGPDLGLSAVDADGGAISGTGGWATMRRIEAVEYAAGFADCFSWGQPDWLAEVATLLAEGFWDGYRGAAAARAA